MDSPIASNLASWQELAERYEALFASERRYDASYAAFAEALPAGARVLEAGCGPAFLLRYLAEHRNDVALHAADGAPAMLALVQHRLPQARCHLFDLTQPQQLPTGVWQGVALPFCISYIDEAATWALLEAVWQATATGGLLYLSFTAGAARRSGWVQGSTGHRMFFYFYHAGRLKARMQQQGWQLIYNERLAYYRRNGREMHQMWVWQKPHQAV